MRRALEWAAAGGGGGGGCLGNFRDEFNAISFAGSDGSLDWAGPWQEVGETGGADAGDIRVMNDQSNYQLRIRDNDNGGEGVERELDLSGASSADLVLRYRRQGLDSASDFVALLISSNGLAGPWTELDRFEGGGTDSSYQSANHNLNSFISPNTAIRLRSSSK